jgi:ketosteroid isomerase-like protein
VAEESVEVARKVLPAFNRSFSEDTADLYEVLAADIEWRPITAAMEGTAYHGHDEVRGWMEELRHDWEVFETRPEEFRDLGDGRVLVLGTWRARGRSSGVELDSQHAAWLMQVRNGKLARHQTFTDIEKAFEAAGLA